MSESLQNIFLGRQPILDRDHHIVAYELLFRSVSQNKNAEVTYDFQASTHVITQAFSELRIADVLGNKNGYINVSANLLLSDTIELLPQDKVVIELPETIQITDQIISRCRDLKGMGFSLALNNYRGEAQFEPLLDIVEVVKFDLLQMGQEALEQCISHIKHWPVKLLAGNVEHTEQAIKCRQLGFDLFHGYYFARPILLTGKRADPSKLAVMQLLSLVQDDAETSAIEQAFKHDPSLSYNLLRLVNTVAVGLPSKISSLRQAVVVLGRQQLQRWLQLLLFVDKGGDMQNPLLELAATRGKLMELLATALALQDRSFHDRAFMTGIMSLLDTLLGMPIEEVVSQINLADDVVNALVKHEGKLGKILLLVEKLEKNDFEAAELILKEIHLTQKHLMGSQLDAMLWANALKENVDN